MPERCKGPLERARDAYWAVLEEEAPVDSAIHRFRQVAGCDSSLGALADVYRGSLTALRAREVFWPQQKNEWALKGIAILDSAIEHAGDDPEALFIHGSTMHYLPFFYETGGRAEASFRRLADLLPARWRRYEPELVENMIEAVLASGRLDRERTRAMERLRQRIEEREAGGGMAGEEEGS
jgi:hypothetical protein